MKLIANNGEVLAEWTPDGTKRNLYCAGGFGLMLTKRALARVMAAEDDQKPDLFEDQTPEQEEKKEDRSFWGLFYG